MADYTPRQEDSSAEPRGFGQHSRGLAGENAHEQGWGLNIEQRRRESTEPQNTDGGTDYDYGAQDFGDEPINMEIEPNVTIVDGPPRQSGSKEAEMAKTNSRSNEMAMKDMDRHTAGEPSGMPMAGTRSQTMRAHTKPVGDMRKVEMKEESNRKVSRADQMRSGNKNR